MKFSWRLVVITLLTIGCKKSDLSPERSESTASVDGVLDTTGYEISLHNNPEGTLYTIRDPKGKVLREEITDEELAIRFPNIHHQVRDLGSINFIEIYRPSRELPIDDPRGRDELFEEPPPPTLDGALIELPPLPDLRTEEQKSRRAEEQKREIRERRIKQKN